MTTTPADQDPPPHSGTAVLLVRVWFDSSHEPRARLLTVTEGEDPTSWGTAAGRAEITAQVTSWVDHVTDHRSPV